MFRMSSFSSSTQFDGSLFSFLEFLLRFVASLLKIHETPPRLMWKSKTIAVLADLTVSPFHWSVSRWNVRTQRFRNGLLSGGSLFEGLSVYECQQGLRTFRILRIFDPQQQTPLPYFVVKSKSCGNLMNQRSEWITNQQGIQISFGRPQEALKFIFHQISFQSNAIRAAKLLFLRWQSIYNWAVRVFFLVIPKYMQFGTWKSLHV